MSESMYQNPERLGREQPIEETAEAQGNYPNFKQKLAQKEIFVISKVNECQELFGNCRLRAAGFQKMTTRALSRNTTLETKILPKKPYFFDNFSQKNSTKTIFAQPEGHMNNEEMLRIIRRHTFEANLQVMRVAVNYRKGLKQLKKSSTSQECLGQTSYLRRSVP